MSMSHAGDLSHWRDPWHSVPMQRNPEDDLGLVEDYRLQLNFSYVNLQSPKNEDGRVSALRKCKPKRQCHLLGNPGVRVDWCAAQESKSHCHLAGELGIQLDGPNPGLTLQAKDWTAPSVQVQSKKQLSVGKSDDNVSVTTIEDSDMSVLRRGKPFSKLHHSFHRH